MIDISYIDKFATQNEFPAEAKELIRRIGVTVNSEKELTQAFDEIFRKHFSTLPYSTKDLDAENEALAQKLWVSPLSLSFVMLILSTIPLRKRYADEGYPEWVFDENMHDFLYKLLEGYALKGIWGTNSEAWLAAWSDLRRFQLGRFQYQTNILPNDYTSPDGTHIPAGSFFVECHIPSNRGPLTDDVRYDSYRRAWEFFKNHRTRNGLLVIRCASWLLYPKHREFLPENSNILRFMDDFDMTGSDERDGFRDAWRVYASKCDLPYAQLPEDTALQRAYKEWLMQTGKSGSGTGMLLFDGKNIVNKR